MLWKWNSAVCLFVPVIFIDSAENTISSMPPKQFPENIKGQCRVFIYLLFLYLFPLLLNFPSHAQQIWSMKIALQEVWQNEFHIKIPVIDFIILALWGSIYLHWSASFSNAFGLAFFFLFLLKLIYLHIFFRNLTFLYTTVLLSIFSK